MDDTLQAAREAFQQRFQDLATQLSAMSPVATFAGVLWPCSRSIPKASAPCRRASCSVSARTWGVP